MKKLFSSRIPVRNNHPAAHTAGADTGPLPNYHNQGRVHILKSHTYLKFEKGDTIRTTLTPAPRLKNSKTGSRQGHIGIAPYLAERLKNAVSCIGFALGA